MRISTGKAPLPTFKHAALKRVPRALLMLTLLGCVSVATMSSAATHRRHGSECHAESGVVASEYLAYSQYGIYNDITVPSPYLICPLMAIDSPATHGVSVYVWDRDTGNSVTVELCDVDATGGSKFCLSASSGAAYLGGIALTPSSISGADGYAYLRASLPPKTANGVSHIATIAYTD